MRILRTLKIVIHTSVIPNRESVIPAQAGIQRRRRRKHWIPASAGKTKEANHFFGWIGLTLPQSAPSHLPVPSTVMVSGWPLDLVVIVVLEL